MARLPAPKDGSVTHGSDRAAYERAVAGESTLYAVWPGEWSSRLLVIGDLDEYAKAHGIKHDVQWTGLTEHVHQSGGPSRTTSGFRAARASATRRGGLRVQDRQSRRIRRTDVARSSGGTAKADPRAPRTPSGSAAQAWPSGRHRSGSAAVLPASQRRNPRWGSRAWTFRNGSNQAAARRSPMPMC